MEKKNFQNNVDEDEGQDNASQQPQQSDILSNGDIQNEEKNYDFSFQPQQPVNLSTGDIINEDNNLVSSQQIQSVHSMEISIGTEQRDQNLYEQIYNYNTCLYFNLYEIPQIVNPDKKQLKELQEKKDRHDAVIRRSVKILHSVISHYIFYNGAISGGQQDMVTNCKIDGIYRRKHVFRDLHDRLKKGLQLRVGKCSQRCLSRLVTFYDLLTDIDNIVNQYDLIYGIADQQYYDLHAQINNEDENKPLSPLVIHFVHFYLWYLKYKYCNCPNVQMQPPPIPPTEFIPRLDFAFKGNDKVEECAMCYQRQYIRKGRYDDNCRCSKRCCCYFCYNRRTTQIGDDYACAQCRGPFKITFNLIKYRKCSHCKTNPRLPDVDSVNFCGNKLHWLCRECIDNQFIQENPSCPHPGCGKSIKKNIKRFKKDPAFVIPLYQQFFETKLSQSNEEADQQYQNQCAMEYVIGERVYLQRDKAFRLIKQILGKKYIDGLRQKQEYNDLPRMIQQDPNDWNPRLDQPYTDAQPEIIVEEENIFRQYVDVKLEFIGSWQKPFPDRFDSFFACNISEFNYMSNLIKKDGIDDIFGLIQKFLEWKKVLQINLKPRIKSSSGANIQQIKKPRQIEKHDRKTKQRLQELKKQLEPESGQQSQQSDEEECKINQNGKKVYAPGDPRNLQSSFADIQDQSLLNFNFNDSFDEPVQSVNLDNIQSFNFDNIQSISLDLNFEPQIERQPSAFTLNPVSSPRVPNQFSLSQANSIQIINNQPDYSHQVGQFSLNQDNSIQIEQDSLQNQIIPQQMFLHQEQSIQIDLGDQPLIHDAQIVVPHNQNQQDPYLNSNYWPEYAQSQQQSAQSSSNSNNNPQIIIYSNQSPPSGGE